MGRAPGIMYRPTDIEFGGAGEVFVVEQFNHRISKWIYTQPSYTFTLAPIWGSNGDGTSGEGAPIGDGGPTDNSLYRPTGITYDKTNNRLYVTDTFHNRVRVLNSITGDFISSFGSGGSGLSNFYHPSGITIESIGDTAIGITDERNHRVLIYDVNGGSPNNPAVLPDPSTGGDLSLISPHGTIFDETSFQFNVTDTARSLISAYKTGGTFEGQFGTPGTSGTDVFSPGSGDGLISGASETGFADTRNSAIKTVDSEVITVVTGTAPGTGDGNLYFPESVTAFTDVVNYVLVANTLNNRIEIYSSAGGVLTSESPFNFGSP